MNRQDVVENSALVKKSRAISGLRRPSCLLQISTPFTVASSHSSGLRKSSPCDHLNRSSPSMSVVQFPISSSCFDMREGLASQEDDTLVQFSLIQNCLAVCKQPSGSFVGKMVEEVKTALGHTALSDSPYDSSSPSLATLSSSLAAILPQYDILLRTAIGGGSTCTCFRNLRHEFLIVRERVQQQLGVEIVVDPSFRSQFDIPHPTTEYLSLLGLVPSVFVGTASKLIPLVQILCVGMARSFASTGQLLPPWRKPDSVLSKWMSAKVKDMLATTGKLQPEQQPQQQPEQQQQQQQQPKQVLGVVGTDRVSAGGVTPLSSGRLAASLPKWPDQATGGRASMLSSSLHHPFCLALPSQPKQQPQAEQPQAQKQQQQPQVQQQQQELLFGVSSYTPTCIRSCPQPMIQVAGFNVQQAC